MISSFALLPLLAASSLINLASSAGIRTDFVMYSTVLGFLDMPKLSGSTSKFG